MPDGIIPTIVGGAVAIKLIDNYPKKKGGERMRRKMHCVKYSRVRRKHRKHRKTASYGSEITRERAAFARQVKRENAALSKRYHKEIRALAKLRHSRKDLKKLM